jgi:hypothetical protein
MTYYFTDDVYDGTTFKTNNIENFYKYYCLATIDYLDGYDYCDDDASEIIVINKIMTLVNNKKWKSAYNLICSSDNGAAIIINPYAGEIYLLNNEISRLKFPTARVKRFTKQMSDMQKKIVFK